MDESEGGAVDADAVERDFPRFSNAVAVIQDVIGDYFGPWQGGPFASARVERVIDAARADHGLVGAGQTSWGPTGFAFAPDAVSADRAAADLAGRFGDANDVTITVHRARNEGANVTGVESDSRSAG